MSSRKQRRIDFSQNLLRNPLVARRVVQQAGVTRDDVVLEIGAGNGILTCELARAARRVIAVEKDNRLADVSRKRTGSFRNVEITEGDFLEYPLPCGDFRVVANIPFNRTAAIVERLLSAESRPTDCHLLVQREAAERFTGRPKTTLVSVLAHPWWTISVVDHFRRSDFVPRPRVDTVLMRMERRGTPLISEDHATLFRDFVTFGFTAWAPNLRIAYRKVLRGSCRIELEERGVDLDRRPGETTIDDWMTLFRVLMEIAPKPVLRAVCGAHDRLIAQQGRLKKCHRTRSRGR